MSGAVGNWLYQPLDQAAEVEYGTRVVRKSDAGTDYPVYGGGGATFYVDRYNREDCTIVARFGMSEECVRRVDGKFFLNDSGLSVRTRNPGVLTRQFLDIQLQSRQGEIYSLGRGAAQKNLELTAFRAMPIAIPPLEEQQRIVAILGEAFEGLIRARANAEANLQNARELSSTTVEAVFDRLATTTRVSELQDVCTSRGITYGVIKLGEHDPDGVPCLRTSNVRPLRIDLEGIKLIAPSLSAEYRRTVLTGGEVLVNVRGTLGGVAPVPDSMAGWNISREVAMVPVDRTQLDPEFASYFISTRTAQAWLTGVIKGAAYKGINLTDLRKLKVPIPALEQQQKILAEIDGLRALVLSVEHSCVAKVQMFADLRQSLLQKAFAGELT